VKRLVSVCGCVALLAVCAVGRVSANDESAALRQQTSKSAAERDRASAEAQEAAAAAKRQQAAEEAAERARAQDEASALKRRQASEAEGERDRARAAATRADLQRLVPLSVDLVVTRYQGDKKISSLPYVLAVNANKLGDAGTAQLRMGAKVPVPSIAAPTNTPAGPVGPMRGPVNYQDIGTNIDCRAKVVDEGFQLQISVSDTSVYTNIQDSSTPTVGNMPVFRSFQSTNTLVLRDGQSREFTAATDRVSGEVVRVAVTLKVAK